MTRPQDNDSLATPHSLFNMTDFSRCKCICWLGLYKSVLWRQTWAEREGRKKRLSFERPVLGLFGQRSQFGSQRAEIGQHGVFLRN